MEHLIVKAVSTATDLGWFTAIAAVFGNVDRDGDRIVKGAFDKTIEAWQDTGRTVPLHWNHSADPDDIIGHVDPRSMVEADQGLVVEGRLDLEGSERARQAWRAMKTGSIGLSFGYLTRRQRKAADGANELLAIDLFEISLTPAPANANARIISWKSIDAPPTDADQRYRFALLTDPEVARVRDDARDATLTALTHRDTGAETKALARERTIEVASFEC